jgi:hypothetical protein
MKCTHNSYKIIIQEAPPIKSFWSRIHKAFAVMEKIPCVVAALKTALSLI